MLGRLPVNAQSAQAQHRDPHRGLLHAGHQLAQRHAEGPVLSQQLEGETGVYSMFEPFQIATFPSAAALSLLPEIQRSPCGGPKSTRSESIPHSFTLMHECFLPSVSFLFFNSYLKEP